MWFSQQNQNVQYVIVKGHQKRKYVIVNGDISFVKNILAGFEKNHKNVHFVESTLQATL